MKTLVEIGENGCLKKEQLNEYINNLIELKSIITDEQEACPLCYSIYNTKEAKGLGWACCMIE